MICRYHPGQDIFLLRPSCGPGTAGRILLLGGLALLTAAAAVRLLPRGGILPLLCGSGSLLWLFAALLTVSRGWPRTVRIRPGVAVSADRQTLPWAALEHLSCRMDKEQCGPCLIVGTGEGERVLLDFGLPAGSAGYAEAACFLEMMLVRCGFSRGPQGALFFQLNKLSPRMDAADAGQRFPEYAPWLGIGLYIVLFVLVAVVAGAGVLFGWRWLQGDSRMLLPAGAALLLGGSSFGLFCWRLLRRLRAGSPPGIVLYDTHLLCIRRGYWHRIPRVMVAGVEPGGRGLLPGLRHSFIFYAWGEGLAEHRFVCRLARDEVARIRSWIDG